MGNNKPHVNTFTSEDTVYMFTATFPSSTVSNEWYLDSGVNQHMSPLRQLFRNYKELSTSKTILLGDNSTHNALGYGSVLLKLHTGESLLINDVLYVPGLTKNLLSVAQITKTGRTTITFKGDECIIKTPSPNSHQNTTFRILKNGNLFSLGSGQDSTIQNFTATTQSERDTTKWHLRLGHLNLRYLSKMQTQDLAKGLPSLQTS